MFLQVWASDLPSSEKWKIVAKETIGNPQALENFMTRAREIGIDFPKEEWTEELYLHFKKAHSIRGISDAFTNDQNTLLNFIKSQFQDEQQRAKIKEALRLFSVIQDYEQPEFRKRYDWQMHDVEAVATLMYQDTLGDLKNNLTAKETFPEIKFLTDRGLARIRQVFKLDISPFQNTLVFIKDKTATGFETSLKQAQEEKRAHLKKMEEEKQAYLKKVEEEKKAQEEREKKENEQILQRIKTDKFEIFFEGLCDTIVVHIGSSKHTISLSGETREIQKVLAEIGSGAKSAAIVLKDIANIYQHIKKIDDPTREHLKWMHKMIYLLLSVDWDDEENEKWNKFKNDSEKIKALVEELQKFNEEAFWQMTNLKRIDRALSPTRSDVMASVTAAKFS